LLAPTVAALKKMLAVASSFSTVFMIGFNASKSKFIIFGQNNVDNIVIVFQGVELRPSQSELHLGMMFGHVTMHKRIQDAANDLYKRTNILLSKFRFASHEVKYRLFKSHCMSLYGYQGWDMSFAGMENMYVAWRKCVRKLLNLPYRTHSVLLPLIVQDLPIQAQIEKRFVKFLKTLEKSGNEYLKLCKNIIEVGSKSALGKSFNYLITKYRWDRENLPNLPTMTQEVYRSIDNSQSEQERLAGQIRELLCGRDKGMNVLTREEIDEVLFHLCVN